MVVRLLKYCLLTAAVVILGGVSSSQTAFAHNNNPGGPNPPGNNGFVKVNDQELDSIPNNDPHVACQFRLDFYNYDLGNTYADVQFALQAPTSPPAHTLTVTGGNLHPFIGGDAAGGSSDLDASEAYTLDFTGTPQPNQGYHVKLTINAPGTNGNDVKHKTFWVEPCAPTTQEVAPELGVAQACAQQGKSDGEVTATVANLNDDPILYTVTVDGTSQDVIVAGHSTADVSFTGIAAGTYTVTAVHGNFSASADVTVETCPVAPKNPLVSAQPGACVAPNAAAGSLSVQVTNPNGYTVNYQVTIGGVTQNLTLAGGATDTLIFTNLTAGTYTVLVTGDNDTRATADATLATCTTPVCTADCGGRGGDTPPVVVTPTTPATPATPTPVVAQLANTGLPLLTPYAFAIILIAVWAALYKRPKVATQSAS